MVLCEMCDGDVYLASRLNLNDLNGNNNSALMLRLFSDKYKYSRHTNYQDASLLQGFRGRTTT